MLVPFSLETRCVQTKKKRNSNCFFFSSHILPSTNKLFVANFKYRYCTRLVCFWWHLINNSIKVSFETCEHSLYVYYISIKFISAKKKEKNSTDEKSKATTHLHIYIRGVAMTIAHFGFFYVWQLRKG